MVRLNQAAFDLLDAELRRCIEDSPSGLAYQFATGRLQRLSRAAGPPASYAELRQILTDLAPNIRSSVLRQAAATNRRSTMTSGRSAITRLEPFSFRPMAIAIPIVATGLFALPSLQLPALDQLPGFTFTAAAVAEVELPRSSELIQTATTFASITQQTMSAKALSEPEWQTVISQWQESIELLQQVSPQHHDYKTAQTLIQQYHEQQVQAQKRLALEKKAIQALQVAQARVIWFSPKLQKMTPIEKAQALRQIERQLQPVTAQTKGHLAATTMLAQMKTQMH
jgi:hypothetical protein